MADHAHAHSHTRSRFLCLSTHLQTLALQFLSIRDHLRAATVCKALKSAVASPAAWDVIDLRGEGDFEDGFQKPCLLVDPLHRLAFARPRVIKAAIGRGHMAVWNERETKALATMLPTARELDIGIHAFLAACKLAPCTKLKRLALLCGSPGRVPEAALFSALSKAEHLQSVALHSVVLPSLPLPAQITALPVTSIETEFVGADGVEGSHDPRTLITAIKQWPLTRIRITCLNVVALKMLPVCFSKQTDIDLSLCWASDAALVSLKHLPLTSLQLHHIRFESVKWVTAKGLLAIRSCPLRDIGLHPGFKIDEEEAKQFFGSLHHLECLRIIGLNLGRFTILPSAPLLSGIQHLPKSTLKALVAKEVSFPIAPLLAEPVRSLRVLDVQRFAETAQNADFIKIAESLVQLRVLRFQQPYLDTLSLDAVVAIGRLPSLTSLEVEVENSMDLLFAACARLDTFRDTRIIATTPLLDCDTLLTRGDEKQQEDAEAACVLANRTARFTLEHIDKEKHLCVLLGSTHHLENHLAGRRALLQDQLDPFSAAAGLGADEFALQLGV